MRIGLIEAHYFPSLTYFCLLKSIDKVILEGHENYLKQSYRNRCLINTSNGIHRLVIPLISEHRKVPITEVKIDYRQKWLDNHCRTIQSAYGKAPFFEYYWHDLHSILNQRYEFLYELNVALLSECIKMTGVRLPVEESDMYEKTPNEKIIDFRNTVNAKNTTQRKFYCTPIRYQPVFETTFTPDLSILDLIFCTGPEAGSLLSQPVLRNEQIDSR